MTEGCRLPLKILISEFAFKLIGYLANIDDSKRSSMCSASVNLSIILLIAECAGKIVEYPMAGPRPAWCKSVEFADMSERPRAPRGSRCPVTPGRRQPSRAFVMK
jgi:hypothetical protein